MIDWTALLDRSDLSEEQFVHEAYGVALDHAPEVLFLPRNVELANRDRRTLLK